MRGLVRVSPAIAAMVLIASLNADGTTVVASDQASMRIFLFDSGADWSEEVPALWSWAPDGSKQIPQAHVPWFRNLSDAKPVLDRSHILATASGGAVILLRVSDKDVRFYAHAGLNPHSAAMLPDGNVVTASSTDGVLRLFATDESVGQFPNSVPSRDYAVKSAHGVVWDGAHLWALGYKTLHKFEYDFETNDPNLREVDVIELPEPGGHDLYPNLDGTALLITTHARVWSFNLESEALTPFAAMPEAESVKAVSQRAEAPRTLYLQACERWWCESARLVGSDSTLTREGARFYKARWWLTDPFDIGSAK